MASPERRAVIVNRRKMVCGDAQGVSVCETGSKIWQLGAMPDRAPVCHRSTRPGVPERTTAFQEPKRTQFRNVVHGLVVLSGSNISHGPAEEIFLENVPPA